MNPYLTQLQPYPFQQLAALLRDVHANERYTPIVLSIGEPKHATPEFIRRALAENLTGLARYPATLGSASLRESIAAWLVKRHQLDRLDAERQVIPVNGSREALFAFAQAVVDSTRPGATVVMPNPFYQIYEGAALLAGAAAEFINTVPANGPSLDLGQLSEQTWSRAQLVYVCSPSNPTGSVMSLDEWKALFELSDRFGFVIASDECYSEIYFDEARPPLGAMQAALQFGRSDFARLVVFGSLSKRSNVPGMRSGFVAGDAAILERFALYRTYHGCAMNPAVQAASESAWNDEGHVRENRRLYRDKFEAVVALLRDVTNVQRPEAAFYLWLATPIDDREFSRTLYERYRVTVLPGSFLAREARGVNPGANYVRVALVAEYEECLEAARRLKQFFQELRNNG